HDWISERGTRKQPAHGQARRALAGRQGGEPALRPAIYAYGAHADRADEPPHQPHFGLTIATCARGELRACADGVLIYGEAGMRKLALPDGGKYSGRHPVLDDMRDAILSGRKPTHDARWGK